MIPESEQRIPTIYEIEQQAIASRARLLWTNVCHYRVQGLPKAEETCTKAYERSVERWGRDPIQASEKELIMLMTRLKAGL